MSATMAYRLPRRPGSSHAAARCQPSKMTTGAWSPPPPVRAVQTKAPSTGAFFATRARTWAPDFPWSTRTASVHASSRWPSAICSVRASSKGISTRRQRSSDSATRILQTSGARNHNAVLTPASNVSAPAAAIGRCSRARSSCSPHSASGSTRRLRRGDHVILFDNEAAKRNVRHSWAAAPCGPCAFAFRILSAFSVILRA